MGQHRHPSNARSRRSDNPVYTARLRRLISSGALIGFLASSGALALPAEPQAAHSLPASRDVDLLDRHAVSEAQAAQRLTQLAASRSAHEAEQAAAVHAQEVASQEAQEAAEEATRQAGTTDASQDAQDPEGTPGEPIATGAAQITNSAGPVSARVQAAADAVVANVPGAAGITLGGTRSSAIDPAGHPSGNALDYMVGTNSALGDAIVAYHVANWDALGVDYIIWQQRILTSPTGAWSAMEDRGSPTANHMDHPHVNYRP